MEQRNEPFTPRSASTYIGRVGALAVALGIGVAVTAGNSTVARADEASPSSGSARAGASATSAGRTSHAKRPAATAPAGTVSPTRIASRRALSAASSTAAKTGAAVNSGAPAAPAETPGLWTLLAAARREFLNASPTITYNPSDNTQDSAGIVTGAIVTSDPDGDPVHYSFVGDPIRGGTVNLDQTTGTLTYTPTSQMLQYGGFDQFTVNVSDQTPGQFPTFHGVFDLISRVPFVGPMITGAAQILGLTSLYTDIVPATITVFVTPTSSQNLIPAGQSAAQLASDPIAANPDWQNYVLTPSSSTVKPPTIYYASGNVTNPAALAGGVGSTTLTYRLGEAPPVVIVDYGQDIGGHQTLQITNLSSPNIIQTAFSETAANMSPIGDGSGTTIFFGNSGDPLTVELRPVLCPGDLTFNRLQGGYRYQLITLAAPGSITLSGVSTQTIAPLTPAADYQGNFLSSSDLLNRIWFGGAYTANLDTIAAGTPGFFGPYDMSILGEAAKRDRAVWAGDLISGGATLHAAFGAAGDRLSANNINLMGANPATIDFALFPAFGSLSRPGPMPGYCRGNSSGGCSFYSTTYSMNFVQNVANYYQTTGDQTVVARNWAGVQRELAYENSLVNIRTGLVDVPIGASLDWSLGIHPGQTTAANVLHYSNLINGARLATLMGDTTSAAQYAAQAVATKDAINANLWNATLGAYDPSTTERGFVIQDANSMAVLYGVADATQAAQIVQSMQDALATPYGLRIADPSAPNVPLLILNAGYANIVSPYASSFTLGADYTAGRPDLAMQLLVDEWGHMVNSDPASTLWEKIELPDGGQASILHLLSDSSAHAWATGATPALTNYVVGITASGPGYQQWQVKPYPQQVDWAQGVMPTTYGAISSRWQQSSDAFRLTVEAPAGTTGAVAVPTLGSARVIYMDGVEVWDGTQAVNGATAAATPDGYVAFANVTGSHTWAWAN